LYGYVGGNPVSFNDPDGLAANLAVGVGVRIVLGRAGAAAIGAALRESLGPVRGGIATCVLIFSCSVSEEAADNESSEGDAADDDAEACPTPDTHPEQFEPVKGKKGKKNKETGEIFEKDQLHKDHYEVYKNKKNYEKGVRDRDVWLDGRSKRKF
jgi:hypothetical protein